MKHGFMVSLTAVAGPLACAESEPDRVAAVTPCPRKVRALCPPPAAACARQRRFTGPVRIVCNGTDVCF